MKTLILTIILTCSSIAAGQASKPSWISVEDLHAKYQSTDDYSYLSNALYRCSALNALLGSLFVRDGRAEGELLLDRSNTQFLMANTFRALRQLEQGADIDLESATLDLTVMESDMYKTMTMNYANWFTYNYTMYGDLTTEPDMNNEINVCAEITASSYAIVNNASN